MQNNAIEILRLLQKNAAGSFQVAQSLPPGIYHDDEIHQLEQQRIFHRDWMCVGRLAELPQPGDYVTFNIADQPILVVRQKDDTVSAFANVCLHRCSRLLEGNGHVSKISCPYHSWTYDLTGQLVGAPFMQRTHDFDLKQHKLKTVSCEVWQGFVYVCLQENPPALGPRLSNLSRQIEDYRIADYVHVHQEEEVWGINWKCLAENFMDDYHLHRVHANSFNKYSSFEDVTEFFPGEDAYAFQYVQEDGGPHSVKAHVDNHWLSDDKRHRTYLINIFPTHLIQLQPDLLWYLSIMPDGIDRVRIRWSVSIPKEILETAEDRTAYIAEEIDFLKQVNGEDKMAVTRVHEATRSHEAQQGPLSWLERNVWDFGRYLARALCD